MTRLLLVLCLSTLAGLAGADTLTVADRVQVSVPYAVYDMSRSSDPEEKRWTLEVRERGKPLAAVYWVEVDAGRDLWKDIDRAGSLDAYWGKTVGEYFLEHFTESDYYLVRTVTLQVQGRPVKAYLGQGLDEAHRPGSIYLVALEHDRHSVVLASRQQPIKALDDQPSNYPNWEQFVTFVTSTALLPPRAAEPERTRIEPVSVPVPEDRRIVPAPRPSEGRLTPVPVPPAPPAAPAPVHEQIPPKP